MEEMKYVMEDGVPTAGKGTPVEVQQTGATLARDVRRIDTNVDLLLRALGVSTADLEEDINETV